MGKQLLAHPLDVAEVVEIGGQSPHQFGVAGVGGVYQLPQLLPDKVVDLRLGILGVDQAQHAQILKAQQDAVPAGGGPQGDLRLPTAEDQAIQAGVGPAAAAGEAQGRIFPCQGAEILREAGGEVVEIHTVGRGAHHHQEAVHQGEQPGREGQVGEHGEQVAGQQGALELHRIVAAGGVLLHHLQLEQHVAVLQVQAVFRGPQALGALVGDRVGEDVPQIGDKAVVTALLHGTLPGDLQGDGLEDLVQNVVLEVGAVVKAVEV